MVNRASVELKDELSELSQAYLAGRPKEERSGLGQFLTPKTLRERLVDHVPLKVGDRVLDPGVGTGEFLRTCGDRVPGLDLVGWDIDPQAIEVAKALVPEARIELRSALDVEPAENFDVVIGNPPYFEVRGLDAHVKLRYRRVLSGRPNIFSMFFQVGLAALKPGGLLGYVVPPSMNNGAFFDALRAYIIDESAIEFLEVYDDKFLFQDVQTAVQLIVLRKGAASHSYTVDLGEMSGSSRHRILFSDASESVESLYKESTTLWHLGYEAVTGTLVWNKHKAALRDEPEPGTIPLIWAHNITDADDIQLSPEHPKKKQYVHGARPVIGPAIVVNRITGSVGSGSLRCALVPPGMEFVGENHVNVIRQRRGADAAVDWPTLLGILRGEGINERVRLLTGNTQLSATELTHWLPLDIPAGVTPLPTERLF